MREIALYVHIPWCIKKCPYCDFNSHRLQKSPQFTRYIDVLIEDLKHQMFLFPQFQESQITSIFIGGGTPSLCPADELNRLLEYVFAHFNCVNNMEVTIEANPGTAESRYFTDYVKAGINRISIGAQSFNDDMLARLGRIHQANENYQAIELAHEAGFKRINIDLMYALPEQSLSMALEDLNIALSCEVRHISYYQLTLEENTSFYFRPPRGIPNEDLSWDISEHSEGVLESYGFRAYEVSAWARSLEDHCQHNLNYWHFGDYIGIGAGAHGKITVQEKDDKRVFRTQHINSPEGYMRALRQRKQSVCQSLENIDGSKKYHDGMRITEIKSDDMLFEYMLNRLRLCEPFSISECQDMTGLSAQYIEDKMSSSLNKGFLQKIENESRLENKQCYSYQKTQLGEHFLNDLIWEWH